LHFATKYVYATHMNNVSFDVWQSALHYQTFRWTMSCNNWLHKITHYSWIWRTISTLVCPLEIIKVFKCCWTSYYLGSTILTNILITDQQQHTEFSQIWGVQRLHFDTVSSNLLCGTLFRWWSLFLYYKICHRKFTFAKTYSPSVRQWECLQ